MTMHILDYYEINLDNVLVTYGNIKTSKADFTGFHLKIDEKILVMNAKFFTCLLFFMIDTKIIHEIYNHYVYHYDEAID